MSEELTCNFCDEPFPNHADDCVLMRHIREEETRRIEDRLRLVFDPTLFSGPITITVDDEHVIKPPAALTAGTLLMADGAGNWLDVTEEYTSQTLLVKSFSGTASEIKKTQMSMAYAAPELQDGYRAAIDKLVEHIVSLLAE